MSFRNNQHGSYFPYLGVGAGVCACACVKGTAAHRKSTFLFLLYILLLLFPKFAPIQHINYPLQHRNKPYST